MWCVCGGLVEHKGATHRGSSAAKKTFRDRFRQIMKQAGWSEDNATTGLQELEDILPHAEHLVKDIVCGWVLWCVGGWMGVWEGGFEGVCMDVWAAGWVVQDSACDNRQAWVQASVGFPEKRLARELVTLYLGCTGSTSNVERTLKKVAVRCERSPNLDSFSELVMCDVHAPRVLDVTQCDDNTGVGQTTAYVGQTTGSVGQTTFVAGQTAPGRIRPKGKYLDCIRKLYKDVFKGRAYRRAPKIRRDKGTKRHMPDTARGSKMSEAAFNRRRDQDHLNPHGRLWNGLDGCMGG